jgi:hypothetical protein
MKFTIPGSILVAASFLPSLNEFARFESTAADTWRVGVTLIFIGMADTFSEHIPNISPVQELFWGYEKKKPLAKFP